MADNDEEKRLLASTSNENENELQDQEIVLSVSSKIKQSTKIIIFIIMFYHHSVTNFLPTLS